MVFIGVVAIFHREIDIEYVERRFDENGQATSSDFLEIECNGKLAIIYIVSCDYFYLFIKWAHFIKRDTYLQYSNIYLYELK